jgi:mono/diheme cytochrome c family protein
MKNRLLALSQLAALVVFTSCSTTPGSSVVTLPAGDPAAGKAAFATMKCYACHTVLGHQFPAPYATPPVPVMLGAEKVRPTPSQLADSIVNPSHILEAGYKEALVSSGKLSRMGDYSDAMTVRQLSDLVAFLETVKPSKN